MKNQTLLQSFHWYYNEDQPLWIKMASEAHNLANLGITGVWLPPAYKGSSGTNSVGYDAYDLFDLGEFDQKNTTVTKYGSKEEYLEAIKTLQEKNILVLADAVFNHKAGADELEQIKVRQVSEENRNEYLSDEIEIKAWTKFTFPGRDGKYSEFKWDYSCFSGVDYADGQEENGLYAIQNEYGPGWEEVPSTELGNYDYLMFNDIEFRNPHVVAELKYWGKWYFETCKVDGFRLDAVKHISPSFINDWIVDLKNECNRDFFIISENWNIESAAELQNYIEITNRNTHLFDSLLHHNFYLASKNGNDFDMNTIFDNTLVQVDPDLAITFVDNHDSQPLQSLESYVDSWFRPLAYSLILLRAGGIPCVFYPDLYGASYEDNGIEIHLEKMDILPVMLKIRSELSYGEQRDYLDHPNCIGWTRTGDLEHSNSGLAILMSNGDEGFKQMEIGQQFSGKTFVDLLGYRNEEILIDENGCGDFFCNAGSVSVWGLKLHN